jgi:V/A-type H+-transporting ATPase subunit F
METKKMATEVKIAAFGESDIMLIFKAIGADVFAVSDSTSDDIAEARLRQLVSEGYGIIFMTETIAARLDTMIKYYSNQPVPSIVVIPGLGKKNNYALNQLRTAIIKAVGADVMTQEEDTEQSNKGKEE